MGTWYRTGTVAVTNGSPDVVGVGTLMLSQASVGDIWVGPDLLDYEITAIVDDTHWSIKQRNGTAAYAGATASAQPHAVIRNFTSTLPAKLASDLAGLMTKYHVTLDEMVAWLSGTGSVTLHDAVGNAYTVKTPAALQAALEGRLVKSVAGGSNVTLTSAEASNQFIDFTGTLTANINVIVPATARSFFFYNATAGAYTITVKTASGSGVAVPQGGRVLLECDATNVMNPLANIPGDHVINGNQTVTGAHTVNGSAALGNGAGDTVVVTGGGSDNSYFEKAVAVGANSNYSGKYFYSGAASSYANPFSASLKTTLVTLSSGDPIAAKCAGYVGQQRTQNGGMSLIGITNGDFNAAEIVGAVGVATPTKAPVALYGQKLSGTSGAALTATEKLASLFNYGTEVMTVYGAGMLELPAGQVKFPATQNASADANTLDDYEEGTWTPVLSFGGLTTGITYFSRAGYYRKVGSLVQAQCYVYLTNKGSAAGSAKIEGLPFTSINQSYGYCAATFWAALVSSAGMIDAYMPFASNYVQLQQLSTAGVNSNLTESNFSNASEVMLTVCYEA